MAMNHPPLIHLHSAVASALHSGGPVVALESTLITHGLPWPLNLQTARSAEAAVRDEGAVPAPSAVWGGQAHIGLSDAELEELAQNKGAIKASRRFLPIVIVQGQTAGTTVA